MHGVFGNRDRVTREIGGQFRPAEDKIVQPMRWVRKFRELQEAQGKKADMEFAAITGKDARTARRYFEGEHDPPGAIVAYLTQQYIADLFKREGE